MLHHFCRFVVCKTNFAARRRKKDGEKEYDERRSDKNNEKLHRLDERQILRQTSHELNDCVRVNDSRELSKNTRCEKLFSNVLRFEF